MAPQSWAPAPWCAPRRFATAGAFLERTRPTPKIIPARMGRDTFAPCEFEITQRYEVFNLRFRALGFEDRRNNKLYFAFRELGRVVRTIFFADPSLPASY
jgi:hypothetical protein